MDNQDLSQYLRQRGLYMSFEEENDPVFEAEDETLNRLATVWNTYKDDITLLINRKINQMKEELLMKARPEEVIVIRQSMVDMASLLDDFEKISQEMEKRVKAERKKQEENQEEQNQQEEIL
jgi:hypothetical protein